MSNVIAIDELHRIFEYRGGELFWRHGAHIRRDLWGKRAGSRKSDGYFQIKVGQTMIARHRAIWAMKKGYWPKGQLDHVNCVPGDDRIENLREADRSQQQGNTKTQKNNKLGIKGVQRHHTGRYTARIYVGGKIKNLGIYDTPEEAHEAYKSAAREKYGEFARW